MWNFAQVWKRRQMLGPRFPKCDKVAKLFLKNAKLNVILTDFTGNICFDLRQELRLMQVSHGFFEERKNLFGTGWGRLFDL